MIDLKGQFLTLESMSLIGFLCTKLEDATIKVK